MKNFFYTLALILVSSLSFAQGTYDDLKILYADGNYEKLVREAEKYTVKEETKKDPMPYLWLARGLYKISVSNNDDPTYKNAFKDALGAVNKFMKYDESGNEMAVSENAKFVHLIQNTLVEYTENEVDVENYRKAYSWVIKYKKISNNVIGEMYLEGACKMNTNDKSSAFTLWREADKLIGGITSLDDWSPADVKIFKLGIIETSKCYIKIRQTSKAQDLLNKVAQWFENDDEFKAFYDEVVN